MAQVMSATCAAGIPLIEKRQPSPAAGQKVAGVVPEMLPPQSLFAIPSSPLRKAVHSAATHHGAAASTHASRAASTAGVGAGGAPRVRAGLAGAIVGVGVLAEIDRAITRFSLSFPIVTSMPF